MSISKLFSLISNSLLLFTLSDVSTTFLQEENLLDLNFNVLLLLSLLLILLVSSKLILYDFLSSSSKYSSIWIS